MKEAAASQPLGGEPLLARPGVPTVALSAVAIGIGSALSLVPLTGDVLLWLAVAAPAVALFAVFWSAGRVTLLSPAIVFTVLYVALTHVGAILFYLQRPDQNDNFLLMSCLTLLAFAAGNCLLAVSDRRHLRALATSLPAPKDDLVGFRLSVWRVYAIIGGLAALFFLLAGSRKVGGVPVIGLLQHSNSGSVRAYAASRLGFAQVPGQGYVFNLYAVVLPLTVLAFAMRKMRKPTRSGKTSLLLLGALTVVTSAAAGYRGQLAVLALLTIVGLSYYRGSVWSPATRRILLATTVVIGVISSLAYASGGQQSSSVGDILVVRVFKIQALGPQYVYGAFPRGGTFSGGSELLHDLSGVLPGRQQGLSSQLPALRGVRSLNNPIGVPAELYLNFGPTGLAIGMLVLGLLCHWVHRRLLQRRTIGTIALGAGLATALGYGAMAGIVGTLFQFGVVGVLVMAGALALLDLPSFRRRSVAPRTSLIERASQPNPRLHIGASR